MTATHISAYTSNPLLLSQYLPSAGNEHYKYWGWNYFFNPRNPTNWGSNSGAEKKNALLTSKLHCIHYFTNLMCFHCIAASIHMLVPSPGSSCQSLMKPWCPSYFLHEMNFLVLIVYFQYCTWKSTHSSPGTYYTEQEPCKDPHVWLD